MEIIKEDPTISATNPLGPDLTSNPNPKKGIKASFIIIFLLAVITIVVFLSYFVGLWPTAKTKTVSEPLPTPIISKSLNLVPSSLATDSGFLKLEKDLQNLQKENNGVDLSEPKISFPNLEMNVSFEK